MNFKSIRYFITLSHCLNFTQAAARHNISQTAMSRYISSLESQLGVKLFNRSSRSVSLTDAGAIFARGMEQIVREYDLLIERTKDAANRFQGHIKVGIGIYEYSNTEQYFSDFLESYSDVKIDILQFEYSQLTRKLKEDDLDLIITLDASKNEFRESEIISEELFSSENVLLLSREKADKLADVSTEDILKKEYLVTNCENDGPSSMKMLENLMIRDLGFMPEHIIQTNSLGAQLLLVKTGHGTALVPEFLKEIRDPDFGIRSLPQKEPQHYCIIMKRDCQNAAAERFFKYCTKGMHEKQEAGR